MKPAGLLLYLVPMGIVAIWALTWLWTRDNLVLPPRPTRRPVANAGRPAPIGFGPRRVRFTLGRLMLAVAVFGLWFAAIRTSGRRFDQQLPGLIPLGILMFWPLRILLTRPIGRAERSARGKDQRLERPL